MRHLTPDHPDFAEVAKSITPISQVKKEAFPRTRLYAEREESQRCRKTRRESVDKSRG